MAERCRTLWPLPGGSAEYMGSLRRIVRLADGDPGLETCIDAFMAAFPSVRSRKAARSYLGVAESLGLITVRGPTVHATEVGRHIARTGDRAILGGLLSSRITGVEEIMEVVRRKPSRIGQIHEALRRDGIVWATDKQVRHRLRWMETAGMIVRQAGRYPTYALP